MNGKFEYSVAQMAQEVNGYKKGACANICGSLLFLSLCTVPGFCREADSQLMTTLSHTDMTSDGGGNYKMFADLAKALDEHVEIVTAERLVQMALASKGKGL